MMNQRINNHSFMIYMDQYVTRRLNFTSSREEARRWSRKNVDFAREAMSLSDQMDTSVLGNKTSLHGLEAYLRERQWTGLQSKNDSDRSMMTVLISQALTYPLTLGAFSNHFSSLNGAKDMRLAVVGARSEATLPLSYWREMLHMCNLVDYNPSSDSKPICWTLDFVGMELPNAKQPPRFITLQHARKHSKLVLNYYKASFHQHIIDQTKHLQGSTLANLWDGFVLFNPGLGHPNLCKLWKPTLDLIAHTNKPLLITAHSEKDQERDRMTLLKYDHVWRRKSQDTKNLSPNNRSSHVIYQLNPFASRMVFDDVVDVGDNQDAVTHLVRPNYSICLL